MLPQIQPTRIGLCSGKGPSWHPTEHQHHWCSLGAYLSVIAGLHVQPHAWMAMFNLSWLLLYAWPVFSEVDTSEMLRILPVQYRSQR